MEPLVTVRALLSIVAVIALLVGFVWLLRRGTVRLSGLQTRSDLAIETAMSLGDRRSLAIVRVDGRRLLIGLTPGNVSMLVDLASEPGAASAGPSTGGLK